LELFETKEIATLHLCNKANFFNIKIQELDTFNVIVNEYGIAEDDYFLSDTGLYYPTSKYI
jgi:hypothetical protein